jgi:RNA polymerase sigma-70 factor, ECF subfamily
VAYEHTHDDERSEADFVRLLTTYQPNLYLFVRSLVPDSDAAAEVLQDTNLVLWEKQTDFRRDTNFLAWAFQVARYKIREQQARHKRKCLSFSDAMVDELALQASQRIAEDSDLISELHRCLAQLAPADRDLIGRRYSSLATCESIANAIGRPVRWVYKALARIREELLECVIRSSNTRKER